MYDVFSLHPALLEHLEHVKKQDLALRSLDLHELQREELAEYLDDLAGDLPILEGYVAEVTGKGVRALCFRSLS